MGVDFFFLIEEKLLCYSSLIVQYLHVMSSAVQICTNKYMIGIATDGGPGVTNVYRVYALNFEGEFQHHIILVVLSTVYPRSKIL